MKYLLTTLLLFVATIGMAQSTGSIVGKITDKEMNDEPLPFANVMIAGSTMGTTTDMDGLFEIANVEPGTYTVQISFIGYKTLELKDVVVTAGKVTNVSAALGADSQMLDEVVVTTTTKKESEVALLIDQKKAVEIKTSIGAQELSRKGVSDAAAAVTKVTGVSKQEGNSGIFVRGLGDRYNATTLNGLPLPSNEPENKNIALDLFSTDVIESVGISKTYNPTLYGDMGGANVEIVSKRHTGAPMIEVSVGSGVNTNAIEQDFKVADGRKYFGFYNVAPPTSTTEYQFGSRWTPKMESTPINGSIGIKGGKVFKINDESSVSAFVTASFNNGYKYKQGSQRIVGVSNDIIPTDFYNVEKFEYGTKTTILGNVAYNINNNNKINFNSIFVNSSSSNVNEYDSFVGQGDDRFEFTRQTLTEQNKLFVNQLLGDHTLNERWSLDWGASFSTVNADMPDRITNNLILTNDTYSYNLGAPTTNNRYFQYIDEKEIAGKALFAYKLFKDSEDEYKGKLTFGYNGRVKSRDFEAKQLNMRITGNNIPVTEDTIDDFLNADNLSSSSGVPNTYYITTGRLTSLAPFTYNGDLTVHAGLASFEHTTSDKFTYSIGVRAEKLLQELEWETNIQLPNVNFEDAKIDKVYILPSATLKYSLNDKQNLRFAASKTYTIPQFKESAPFRYEGVGENSVGNPFLKPSDNYNLDVKWELFPSSSELISFTAFGKYIDNPISKVLLNSVLNDNTFVNAGDYAYVFGGEVDVRKNIWQNNEDATSTLTGGLNFTVMYSHQKLDAAKVAADTENTISVNFNDETDALQGASPLLVNADLTYKNDEGSFRPTVSLVGNYFHDRIYSLGSFGRGNIVEKGIPTLNFISSAAIGEHFEVSLKAQNLLNSKIRRVQENEQGDVDTYSFKAGLDLSIGIKYNIF